MLKLYKLQYILKFIKNIGLRRVNDIIFDMLVTYKKHFRAYVSAFKILDIMINCLRYRLCWVCFVVIASCTILTAKF